MFLSGKKGLPFLLNKITSNAQEEEDLCHRLRVRSLSGGDQQNLSEFDAHWHKPEGLECFLQGNRGLVWFTPQNNKLNAQEEPVPPPC